ncbi:MAG: hypothetical protein JNM31_15545 [Flavobacteriales bacterium]|nr:hypothetical protein [Flavobacteriales bacterium]
MGKAGSTWKQTAWVALVCLIALEGAPYILGPVATGERFSRAALHLQLLDTLGTYGEGVGDEQTEEYLGDHLLHPYMGFISVPRKDRNRFGLPGADPLMHRSADTVNVCITGGSVAMGLLTHATAALTEGLQADPRWRGKHIRYTAFALGGFKQPQPLEALAWFHAQGAHYDLVIALDGFNEVVLPWCDNRTFGVHPTFPRHWNMYARKRIDNRVLRAAVDQVKLAEERRTLRHRFARAPWRWSNAALLLWRTMDHRLANRQAEVEERSRRALEASGTDVQATGPPADELDSTTYLNASADIWMRASQMMSELVRATGGSYFHFLQPNQYVPNSKPFTAEERALAIEPGPFCYRDVVQAAYPLMQARASTLREAGVAFEDLTPMFREEPRTVYSDKCCHFTPYGYRRIANRIAASIVAHRVEHDP